MSFATSRLANDRIVVGLVNLMPDGALQATERQFGSLLADAAGNRSVELKMYSLPEVPRSDTARAHMAQRYLPLGELWGTKLDGLIVTGTQPRTRNLLNEPYWTSLTRIVDWAKDNTESTLWSCLAAHAALFHLDGIERHTFDAKISGVFRCTTLTQHPLADQFPAHWHVPHSRYNEIQRSALLANGYRILSQSELVGVDLFVKELGSLFVFCQGHPEYDADTLMREYRCDIVKFLKGERNSYPGIPCNYFDAATTAELEAFRLQAEANRTPELSAKLPIAIKANDMLTPHWRSGAVRMYKNWVSYLAERKAQREPISVRAS